jgi:WD40 repeat protein/serine/threonine protein kinase
MPHKPASADEELLADLLARYDDCLASGETGPAQEQPPDELRDRLEEDVACLRLLQSLRPPLTPNNPSEDQPTDDAGDCAARGESRYEILDLHATGGIGRVWRARDGAIGRCVALKDLHPAKARQRTLRSRFLREAQITGQLQHPGIVPVYDVVTRPAPDAPGGVEFFYTMRFIEGRTLSEAARDYHRKRAVGAAGALDLIGLLNAFISACNTLAYANARGVVHRDLKGANVVLGDFGEVVVVDWGFAKVLRGWDGPSLAAKVEDEPGPVSLQASPGEGDTPSLPGDVMGTPAYMAPEQAAGRPDCVDHRADVYGLGAILYEILTGQPPYPGDDAAEVLRRVRTETLRSPSQVRPGIPWPLEAVCLKAMARDPAGRYDSAVELAREVQHWLADEPVQAYPEPLLAWLGRWARRHKPAVAGAVALLLTAVAAGVIGVVLLEKEQARVAAVRAEADRQQAVAEARARAELAAHVYYQRIALAEREVTAGNISRAIQYLADCPPVQRGWEWHCLQRQCRADQLILRGHTAAVATVVFSPDGRQLVSGSHDRTIRFWDAATGMPLRTLTGHTDAVYALAFTPNGRRFASASWDRTVRLWDPATGRELRSFGPHKGEVYRLALSPDGRYIASATGADVLTVWDADTGAKLLTRTSRESFFGLAFSPTQPGVLAASYYRTIRLLSIPSGEELATLTGHNSVVKYLAFSRDGRLLASGDGDLLLGDRGTVRVWDPQSGRTLYTFQGHTDPIYSLAFSLDSRYLASASQDKTAKLWDLWTGQEALTLRGHTDTVRSLAFGLDGSRLATASADSTIRIWDATPWTEEGSAADVRTVPSLGGRGVGAVFSPDGRSVASGTEGPAVKVWDADTGKERFSAPLTIWSCTMTYSPDGKVLAAGRNDGSVLLLDAATGRSLGSLQERRLGPIYSVAFSPDGRYVAAGGWWRMVQIWDLERREPVRSLARHSQPVLAIAFDPTGCFLATAGYDQTVLIWDVQAGEPIQTLTGHGSRVQGLAFSSDGRSMASASHDGTVRLWDTTTWQLVRVLHGHAAGVSGLAFSPDGRRLASAGDDWVVRVWDVKTGGELRTLRGHDDRVYSVAFSPDGRRLVSASHDRSVKIWELSPDEDEGKDRD